MAATAPIHMHPIVLQNASLSEFLRYIVEHHAVTTTLIVCSSREAFLNQLHATLSARESNAQDGTGDQAGVQSDASEDLYTNASLDFLLTPTLHLLASCRTIQLVFCPELPNLHAFLSAHIAGSSSFPTGAKDEKCVPTLAILNSIAVHRNTSAFSAQGLSRTFALAVEAAYRVGQKLVVVEYPTAPQRPASDLGAGLEEFEVNITRPGERGEPWEEEISILNVTTRRFGAGERGWVGRTVKVRTVMERWCAFEGLPDPFR
ncbi:hypothetical protein LTR66_011530 [Elasticomyces elasticus]|nr:hypothetical protein LTR66_011530 [Elasticomyces elasticus]